MTSTTTATLGRFVWHELMTTDPIAAQAFYKDVVGWTTSAWGTEPANYTMWMAGPVPIGGVASMMPDAVAMGALPSWTAIHRDSRRRPHHRASRQARFNAAPLADENDPQPLEFSWHELVADDPRALIDFYFTLFGWETKGEFDMGAQGVYREFGRDRFAYGGVMKKPEGMNVPPHWVHYVRVQDSADAAVARAIKAGGTVMVDPTDVPGGDRIAVLQDPQGAMFAVHSKPAA